MPDMSLQKKIIYHAEVAYSIIGKEFVGKEFGQIPIESDRTRLLDAENISAELALDVIVTRIMLKANGAKLAENAPCYEVCDNFCRWHDSNYT